MVCKYETEGFMSTDKGKLDLDVGSEHIAKAPFQFATKYVGT